MAQPTQPTASSILSIEYRLTPGIDKIACISFLPSIMNKGQIRSVGARFVSAIIARIELVHRSLRNLVAGNFLVVIYENPIVYIFYMLYSKVTWK